MKRVALLSCIMLPLVGGSPVTAADFFPDFALVVQIPGHEAFLTNLGDAPIRVDGYAISSPSGSLDPAGWAPMDSAGPELVTALGPGADGFFIANPSQTSLAELNPLSSATWQPGQSWRIGFPFRSDDPTFVLDVVFRFASPDGLVLTGGTVVPPSEFFPAAFLVIPEPATLALAATGFGLCIARRHGRAARSARRGPQHFCHT